MDFQAESEVAPQIVDSVSLTYGYYLFCNSLFFAFHVI